MGRNAEKPPATGHEGEPVCEECHTRGGHAEDCSKRICDECRGVGGHYKACSQNTQTVDGQPADVDTNAKPRDRQPQVIHVGDTEILRTIGKKMTEIDRAEKAHTKTGDALKARKKELQEILDHVPEHVAAADHAAAQTEIPFETDEDPKCWNQRCVRREHGDELHKDAAGIEFAAERPPRDVTNSAQPPTIEGTAVAVNRRGEAGGSAPAALPPPRTKPKKKRGQSNAEALLEWAARMKKKTGKPDVRDTTAGVRLKWLPALAREIYGTDWKKQVPEEGPTSDAALLRAQRWEEGEAPEWAAD